MNGLYTREATQQMGTQRREAFVEGIDEAARTVRFRFSTGSRRKTIDWANWRYINEELSVKPEHVRLDRLNKGAPFLKDHRAQMDCQIGVHSRAWIEGGEAWGTAKIFADERSEECWQKILGGAKNISVGYRVYTYEITENDGELPLYRAVDWEPLENSLVAINADADAQIRSDSSAATPSDPKQNTELYTVTLRSHPMNELQQRLMGALLTRLGATDVEQIDKKLTGLESIATAARAATGKDDPAEVQGALKALSDTCARAAELEGENKGLREKVAQVENQELGRAFRELTEGGQREGKLTPSQLSWARSECVREETLPDGSKRETYLADGLRMLRGFLSAAPAMGPGLATRTEPTAGAPAPATPALRALTADEQKIARTLSISDEQMARSLQQTTKGA
jgi:hypothetical protein